MKKTTLKSKIISKKDKIRDTISTIMVTIIVITFFQALPYASADKFNDLTLDTPFGMSLAILLGIAWLLLIALFILESLKENKQK